MPVRVVVDVREFMSHLPAVLHQQGFEVVPVTLEVRPWLNEALFIRIPGAVRAMQGFTVVVCSAFPTGI